MSPESCQTRRFTLRLGPLAARVHTSYASWMRYLVERLGAAAVRQLWSEAFSRYDRELLDGILASGWSQEDASGSEDDAAEAPAVLGEFLGDGDRGMSRSEAESLIRGTPPLQQFHERYPELNVQRESTAFEALHVYAHGIALLAEALVARYGKQGELIAYDILSAGRTAMGQRIGGPAAKFFDMIDEESDEPDIYSAGLEAETVTVSATEHVSRVTECEWARYFREKHPTVGYLVACSTDEAFARGFSESLRFQRTSTLMEGGSECDFRYYSVGGSPAESGESEAT